ncbi:hypothetical protein AKJ53_01815 [candidate division MSBL1 archaeon SCGC-AAA382F02]|uniref:DOD-type homing endonuclease domain-containing protein n=1 Tax=candidate division MSBL1 archaeon SCGC-AAA382F02 TaxID=1698282 RepID=A0A133VHF6_9EURY|nr:hypothetical protein AKJ53_01815 [candidate division MSBL1 archaeon SCGC-AAA382F02]
METDPLINYLLGLMLGDGGIYDNNYTVFVDDSCKTFVKQITEIASEKLGTEVHMSQHSANSWRASSNLTSVWTYFSTLGVPKGRKSKTVSIPSWVFQEKMENKLSVIQGLYDAEGYVGIDKQRHGDKTYQYPYIGIDMTSKKIINQIANILRENGLSVSINQLPPRGWSKHRQWRIVVKGERKVTNLAKTIGFKHPQKMNDLEKAIE